MKLSSAAIFLALALSASAAPQGGFAGDQFRKGQNGQQGGQGGKGGSKGGAGVSPD